MLTNVIMLICMLHALRVLYKNRATLKKLSVRQWMNVLVVYAGAVGVLFVAVYYGANWISSYFSNTYARLAVFLVLMLVVFALIETPFKKLRHKATGGLVE